MADIRQFNTKDISRVSRLVKSAFKRKYSKQFYLDWYTAWPEGQLVAEKEGKVCGFLMSTREDDSGRVLIMVVEDDLRGRGIGSAMLTRFMDICKCLGHKTVTLEVRTSSSDAIKFYQGFDFKIISTLEKYYEDGISGYVMIRSLKDL